MALETLSAAQVLRANTPAGAASDSEPESALAQATPGQPPGIVRNAERARLLEPLFSSISCTVFRAEQCALTPGQHIASVAEPQYRLFVGVTGEAGFVVDGAPCRLTPGSAILVPPRVSYTVRAGHDAPLTAYVLDFEARLHGILDVPAFCGLPVALVPTPLRQTKIVASANTIVHHLTNLIPGYQLAVHTHCVRLLDLLWKEALARREARSPLPGPVGGDGTRALALLWMRPALELVETRYADRLTLADFAGTVHLHPAYFCTIFKRVTGIPPHEYLARYRVERARDLLLATDLPLEEVAHRTGFYDAAHLIRVFRRVEGLPPGRYRRVQTPQNA